MIKRGDFVVNCLNGKIGMVLERYHHNFNPYYADWHIWFEGGTYEIVRERHLRLAMVGEKRRFLRK